MKRIVNLSGGANSWLTAQRVKEQHGTDDLVLLFADTMIEDEDLHRFLADVSESIGVPITRIADGRDPWEVFFTHRMMGNSRIDLCSRILKRELLDRWHEDHCDPFDTTIYVGISWDESHRLLAIRDRLAPWRVESPLCEWPYLTKPQVLAACREAGIVPPRLYEMGFPHNNCGGFCVKAGQAQFLTLLRMMPERYRYHEEKEQEFRAFIGKDVSIMRDRTGGETKPLTLRAFRERIEAGGQCDLFDWGGCGCGV